MGAGGVGAHTECVGSVCSGTQGGAGGVLRGVQLPPPPLRHPLVQGVWQAVVQSPRPLHVGTTSRART